MHSECYDFVRRVKASVPSVFKGSAVVEIGSRDVNGSVRPLFDDCRYVGVDVSEGPGVDVVASGRSLPFADGEFDAAISTEVFEHVEDWRSILAEMKRVVRVGGVVIVTAATTGRHAHGIDEFGFGFYGNVRGDDLRRQNVGDVLFFEEDFVACDVRVVWRVRPGRMTPIRTVRRPKVRTWTPKT